MQFARAAQAALALALLLHLLPLPTSGAASSFRELLASTRANAASPEPELTTVYEEESSPPPFVEHENGGTELPLETPAPTELPQEEQLQEEVPLEELPSEDLTSLPEVTVHLTPENQPEEEQEEPGFVEPSRYKKSPYCVQVSQVIIFLNLS